MNFRCAREDFELSGVAAESASWVQAISKAPANASRTVRRDGPLWRGGLGAAGRV